MMMMTTTTTTTTMTMMMMMIVVSDIDRRIACVIQFVQRILVYSKSLVDVLFGSVVARVFVSDFSHLHHSFLVFVFGRCRNGFKLWGSW